MSNEALLPGDRVFVVGSVSELGSWKELKVELSHKVAGVYSSDVVWRTAKMGDSVLYKFVVVRSDDQPWIWERGGNRVVVVKKQQIKAYEPVFFSNRRSGGIKKSLHTVVFRVDTKGLSMNGSSVEGLFLAGESAPLQWNASKALMMEEISEDMFEIRFAFPYGTPKVVPFKLLLDVEGEPEWEYLPGHINHAVLLDEALEEQVVGLFWNNNSGRFESRNDNVDNFVKFSSHFEGSDWYYARAITHLHNGESSSAWQSYKKWEKDHPGGSEIDDFLYLWANHLAITDPFKGEKFIRNQLIREKHSYRRAHFRYLLGEQALNRGDLVTARKQLRQVLALENKNDTLIRDVINYTYSALAVSYAQEKQEDSLRLSELYLLHLTHDGQPVQWKKRGYRMQSKFYEATKQYEKLARSRRMLASYSVGAARMEALLLESESWQMAGQPAQCEETLKLLEAEAAASPDAFTELRMRKLKRMFMTGNREGAAALMVALNQMQVPRTHRLRLARMERELKKKQD